MYVCHNTSGFCAQVALGKLIAIDVRFYELTILFFPYPGLYNQRGNNVGMGGQHWAFMSQNNRGTFVSELFGEDEKSSCRRYVK
jgi:hypothetical protein